MCSSTSPGLTLTLQVSTLYVTLCVQTMRVATYQIILELVTQLSYSMSMEKVSVKTRQEISQPKTNLEHFR